MNAKSIMCAVALGLSVLYAVNSTNAQTLGVTDNLGLWLEADYGVTESSGVVLDWTDRSGHVTVTPSGDPMLSGNAISFDGINDVFNITGSVITSQSFTIFAVVTDMASPTDISDNRNIFSNWHFPDAFLDSVYFGTLNGTAPNRSVRLNNYTAPIGVAPNTPLVLNAVVTQGVGRALYDGNTLLGVGNSGTGGSGTYSIDTPTYYTIGDHNNLDWANEHFLGKMNALLVYNVALSDTDREAVTAYLNTKYGVPEVPGDFDGDGNVDGADFVAWQTHFPTASGATLADGDADGDGDVDGADFVVWQTNFPFTPSSEVSPVPEPQTLMLLAIGGTIAMAWRRRRRR